MSGMLSLLFSFKGRISRRSFLFGSTIAVALSLLGSFLINPEAFIGEDTAPLTLAETIWQLCALVPLTALSVKRFNDRDWPWWFGYVPSLILAVWIVADPFGNFSPEELAALSHSEIVVLSAIGFVVLLASADNAFLKGTAGPNRYGPDPLQKPEQTRE